MSEIRNNCVRCKHLNERATNRFQHIGSGLQSALNNSHTITFQTLETLKTRP